MIPNQDRNIFIAAIGKWGVEAQIDQAIEEAAELIVALRHMARDRPTDIFGEIADISIMVDQLKIIFGEEASRKARDKKILRLQKRVVNNEAV